MLTPTRQGDSAVRISNFLGKYTNDKGKNSNSKTKHKLKIQKKLG